MRFSTYLLTALVANVCVLSIRLRIANSCHLYREMISQAVTSSHIRAIYAHHELTAWNKPSVQRFAKRLFGSSIEDVRVRTAVGDIFREIYGINFMNYQAWHPLWNDGTQGRPDDFIIYCDYNRFTRDVFAPMYWYDRNNSVRMPDSQMQRNSAQQGAKIYTWQWRHPVTSQLITASQININAWYLRLWHAEWDLIHDPDAAEFDFVPSWNHPVWMDLNSDPRGDQDEADAAVREILRTVQGSWMNFWQVKLDALLLRELSHMVAPGGDPIADTYSIFATVVKLINLGYTVTDDGQWR